MKKILVICGPTATGKTALGVKLAHRFGGEIVSADSRQVYQGMDIGTGKDLGELRGTPVWLLDVVRPDQLFSVADYLKLAWEVLADIWARGKLPVVVGGTGFYIKALTDGIGTLGIPPDWELRKKLQNDSVSELQNLLRKKNPQRWARMNESDRKNPRRLVRAIEVAGKPLNARRLPLDAFFIGLTAPYEILYRHIDERVDKRIKEGIEKEIKGLKGKGYNFKNSVLGTTIGYREWAGEGTREEIVRRWQFAEHDLARRQMTWFRKALRQTQGKFQWFDIGKLGWQKEVEKAVQRWYSKTDNDKEG